MTSTEYTSNQKFSSQSVFKNRMNFFPRKPESKFSSRNPSFFNPRPLNAFTPNSNFSLRKFSYNERISSFYSVKNEQDNELNGKVIFPAHLHNKRPSFFEFPMEDEFIPQSKYFNFNEALGKKFRFEPTNFILNLKETNNLEENDEENKEIITDKIKKEKNNDISKSDIVKKDNNKFNYNEKCNIERNVNLNLNTPTNYNMGAKFFTNHNYGYKCSCSKTQCNRKYCECYNSGNYCIDCNCKNCSNKPPINTYSNKRPTDITSKMKKSKEICTCTKSGCNKNYCECFKSGNKCTSLCRCIGCENTEENIKTKSKNFFNYECCPANSIFIIKNKIVMNNEIHNYEENGLYENKNDKIVNKKRKRENIKNSEKVHAKKDNSNKQDVNNFFNDSLFDENGKVILRHINMISY